MVSKAHVQSLPKVETLFEKNCSWKSGQKGQPFKFDYKSYKAKFRKPSTTVDLWSSKPRKSLIAVSLHLQEGDLFTTKLMKFKCLFMNRSA